MGRVGRISLRSHHTEGGGREGRWKVSQQRGPSIRESAARGGRGGQGGYSSPRSLQLETWKQEASPNSRGRGEGYDKKRRGRGGIEPHLERQTTASPKSQVQVETREREREMIERREREERGERGETHRALCRENGQVWEGPRSCGPQTTHHHMIF